MVFRIALGKAHGVRVALGDISTTEGKAGGVEMMEAWRKAFLVTDGSSQLTKQQITPLGLDFIECPTTRKAMEHLRSDPGTPQQIERFVGKKLGGKRQRAIGKPQAIEDPPGYCFTRCDLLLFIRHEASVNHAYQA